MVLSFFFFWRVHCRYICSLKSSDECFSFFLLFVCSFALVDVVPEKGNFPCASRLVPKDGHIRRERVSDDERRSLTVRVRVPKHMKLHGGSIRG